MEAFFSASNHFLFLSGFFPSTIRCGITTNFFGDGNYYNEGGSDDCIKHLGKCFHASEIFAPIPQHGTIAIQAQPEEKKKKNTETKIFKDKGDAIILQHNKFKEHHPLILFPTGDCPAVLLHNKKMSAIIHCGWRGLEAKILTSVIDELKTQALIKKSEFKTKAIVWPGICQEHYQVTDDVARHFPEEVDNGYLNLAAAIKKELISLNFPLSHIAIPDFCSFHSQKGEENVFSSYRRGDKTRNVIFMSHQPL